MSIVPELADFFPDVVEIEKWIGGDGMGGDLYDAAYTFPARVSGKIQRVMGTDGIEKVSRLQVALAGAPGISERDQFILPERFSKTGNPTDLDSRRATPLAISSTPDENGPHHEKAYF